MARRSASVIFAVLQNGVQLLGINQFWLQAVVGAAILATVIFYSRSPAGPSGGARGAAPAAGWPTRPGKTMRDAEPEFLARWEVVPARWSWS